MATKEVSVGLARSGRKYTITINPYEVPVKESDEVEWKPIGSNITGITAQFDKDAFTGGTKRYGGKGKRKPKSKKVKKAAKGKSYKYTITIFTDAEPTGIVIDPRMKVG